jgi:hypothetical protein
MVRAVRWIRVYQRVLFCHEDHDDHVADYMDPVVLV